MGSKTKICQKLLNKYNKGRRRERRKRERRRTIMIMLMIMIIVIIIVKSNEIKATKHNYHNNNTYNK